MRGLGGICGNAVKPPQLTRFRPPAPNRPRAARTAFCGPGLRRGAGGVAFAAPMDLHSDRLAPLPPERWDAATRRILGGTLAPVRALEGGAAQAAGGEGGGTGGPLNILRPLAHHPALLEPFLDFAAALALRGVLGRRESELLALRTAWNCASAFEWGHHVLYARAAGLSGEEIARIAAAQAAEEWEESERLLLCAADELHRNHTISDATWQGLRAHFNDAQLVEIPFVVGNYTMLSMLARSLDVPVEAGLPPLPKR